MRSTDYRQAGESQAEHIHLGDMVFSMSSWHRVVGVRRWRRAQRVTLLLRDGDGYHTRSLYYGDKLRKGTGVVAILDRVRHVLNETAKGIGRAFAKGASS